MRTLFLAAAVLAATPLQAQLPASAAERIEAARTRVEQAGIPVELIENRIAEGRAKGAPEERVAQAAERRAEALARAQEAMSRSGRTLSGAEIAAGGDAVEAGVDAAALRAVIEAARAGEGPVALAVLAELTRQGMPVERAVEAVTRAMAEGRGVAHLPEQALAARERRGPPEGAGPPAGAGGPPAGVGGVPGGVPAGPPAGVPAPGQPPASGRPGGPPGGPPSGTPGGPPAGTPGHP
jgi:hypothetical protein